MPDPIDLLKRVVSENGLKADPNDYLKRNQGNYTEAMRSMLNDNGLGLDPDMEEAAHKEYGLPVLNKIFIDKNWKSDNEVKALEDKSNELFDRIQKGVTWEDIDTTEGFSSVLTKAQKDKAVADANLRLTQELAGINDTLAKNDQLRSLGFKKVDRSPLGQRDLASLKREAKGLAQKKLSNIANIPESEIDEKSKQKLLDGYQNEKGKEIEDALYQEKNEEPKVVSYQTALKNGAVEAGTGKNAYVAGLGIMNEADAKLRRQFEMAIEDFKANPTEEGKARIESIQAHLEEQENQFAKGFDAETAIKKAEETNRAAMELATSGAGWAEKAGLSFKADVGRMWHTTIGPGISNLLSPLRDESLDDFIARRKEQGMKGAQYQKPAMFEGAPLQRYVEVEGKRFKVDQFGDIMHPVDDRMKAVDDTYEKEAKIYEANRDKYDVKYDFSASRLLGTSLEVAVNMSPIIATNLLTGVIPGVGAIKGAQALASMGASFMTMFNPNFEKALQAGGSFDKAWNTAMIATIPQTLIEQIGGFEARTGRMLGDAVKSRLTQNIENLVAKYSKNGTPQGFWKEWYGSLKKELPGELFEELSQDVWGSYVDHARNGMAFEIDPLDELNMGMSLPFSVGGFSGIVTGIKAIGDKKRWRESFLAATANPEVSEAVMDKAIESGAMKESEKGPRMALISDNHGLVKEVKENDRLTEDSRNEVLRMVADRALLRAQAGEAKNNRDRESYQKKADAITDESIRERAIQLEEDRGGVSNNPYSEAEFKENDENATINAEPDDTRREPEVGGAIQGDDFATKAQNTEGEQPTEKTIPEEPTTTTDGGVGGADTGAAVPVVDEQPKSTPKQVDRATAFKEAGEKGKSEGSANPIADLLLDMSTTVGDEIVDKNGDGYEVTEASQRNGKVEVILVPFEIVDGKKDYNYSGTKIVSTNNKKAASDLYEFSYTNSKGERIVENYSYKPINQSTANEVAQERSEAAPQEPVEANTQPVQDNIQPETTPDQGSEVDIKTKTQEEVKGKVYYQGIPKTTSFMQGLLDENGNELIQGSLEQVEKYKKDKGIQDENVEFVDLDTANPNSLINKFLNKSKKIGSGKPSLPTPEKEVVLPKSEPKKRQQTVKSAEKKSETKTIEKTEPKVPEALTKPQLHIGEDVQLTINGKERQLTIEKVGTDYVSVVNEDGKREHITGYDWDNAVKKWGNKVENKVENKSEPQKTETKESARIVPAFESNIEALINPETGLAAVLRKGFEEIQPYKDAFLKRIGITIDEYRKLDQDGKQKIENKWRKSQEFKEATDKIENKNDTPKSDKSLPIEVDTEVIYDGKPYRVARKNNNGTFNLSDGEGGWVIEASKKDKEWGGAATTPQLQATSRQPLPIDEKRFNDLLANLNEAIKDKMGGVLKGKEFADKLKEQSGKEIKDVRGTVYGFKGKDGKVYLNGDKINANTPVHEYSHIYLNIIKDVRKDIYDKGLDIIDKTPYVEQILNNPDYKDIADQYKKGNKEPLLEEALATAIGDRGEMIVNAADSKSFREWLKDFWNSIKEFFGGSLTSLSPEKLQALTPLEFIELAAAQLVGGEEVNTTFNPESNDIRYQVIGERGAENIPVAKQNLQVARDMEQAGKDAKTIWISTGWQRGVDKNWRYEIPDLSINRALPSGVSIAENVITADEIFEAYPSLKTVPIFVINNHENAGSAAASFPLGIPIVAVYRGGQGEGGRLVEQGWLTHEFQHIIQRIEGFPEGGSPKIIQGRKIADILQRERDRIEEFIGKDVASGEGIIAQRLQEYLDQFHPDVFKNAFDEYNRLAGEVEARNAENRRSLTIEKKRQTPLSETEDVARESQIFLFDEKSPQFQIISQRNDYHQRIKDTSVSEAKRNLQRAWDAFKEVGIANDPEQQATKMRALIAAIMEYAIKQGAKTVKEVREAVENFLGKKENQPYRKNEDYIVRNVVRGIRAFNKSDSDELGITEDLEGLTAEESPERVREMAEVAASPERQGKILRYLDDLVNKIAINDAGLMVPVAKNLGEFERSFKAAMSMHQDPDSRFGQRDQSNYANVGTEQATEFALKPSTEESINYAEQFIANWHAEYLTHDDNVTAFVRMVTDWLKTDTSQDKVSSNSIRRGLLNFVEHLKINKKPNTPNTIYLNMIDEIKNKSGVTEWASAMGAAFRSLQRNLFDRTNTRDFDGMIDRIKGLVTGVTTMPASDEALDPENHAKIKSDKAKLMGKEPVVKETTEKPSSGHSKQAKKILSKSNKINRAETVARIKEAIKKCR